MSIASSDIKYYKSSATNSDGGTITATQITDNSVNNLFPDVSAAQASSGLTDYRKMFVKNTHGSLSWTTVELWRQTATTSADDEITLGIGSSSDDDGTSVLSSWSASAKVALISDGTDTRNVTIVGEDASGVRQTETVALTSAVEVLSTNNFTVVYLVYVSSTSASRAVTIKQGTGGTTRGTIAINKYSAIWYNASAVDAASAFELGDLAAGASQAIWVKRVVNSSAAAATADTGTIRAQGSTT